MGEYGEALRRISPCNHDDGENYISSVIHYTMDGLHPQYYLIDNLTNDRYSPVRKSLYNYHMSGLDIMHKDIAKGRDEVFKALENFQELTKIYPNSMLVKVFFNAKYREIIEIFKGAPSAEQTKAIEIVEQELNKAKRRLELLEEEND